MTTHTTTDQAPHAATYQAARKLAAVLPTAQVRALVQADGNPIVYQPRRPRRIAFSLYVSDYGVVYDYCDRQGYTREGVARWTSLVDGPTVFRLRDGRYVASGVDVAANHAAEVDRLRALFNRYADALDAADLGIVWEGCQENTADRLGPEPTDTYTAEAVAWWAELAAAVRAEADARGVDLR